MSPLSNKERMQIQRHEMPAQEPEVRAGNFEEVALGYTWEDALGRGRALSAMRQARLCLGLPGRRADSAVHQGAARGRYARRGRGDAGEEQPAGHLRPRLPAGIAVRGGLYRRQEGPIGRHRPAGALRGRLRPARAPQARAACPGYRPQGRGGRLRPCGAHLRGRPGQAGPQGDDLRVAARARWRAGLRHPGIPPAQEYHPGGDRDRLQFPGHRDAHRSRHRQHLHPGRAAGRIRRDLHGHGRGPAELHAHPRHQPERGDVGQRIPHPRQPDEGLPLPRIRHAGEDRPQGGRDRRGQRGDGFGAQQPAFADLAVAARAGFGP